MRVLVYPHLMEIGGSQLNALELARCTAENGHDVVLFGPGGALLPLAADWGLEYVRAPHENSWPSPRSMWALLGLVRDRSIDVVHGYEWGPAIELAFGPHLVAHVPLVVTIQSMQVPAFIPGHLPMIVGTAELARQESARRAVVHLMEPPIDTRANAPSDRSAARARWDLDEHEVVLSVVCRLTPELGKVEGVLEAISVVDDLAWTWPVRFLVVGDGPGLAGVQERAAQVNSSHGRRVVVVAGGVLDPRDAYAAADVVLGMGSSALKGMAFRKALVVQGARGFWRLLDESSLPVFLEQGWYGNGGGGASALRAELTPVLEDPARRARLGTLGRDLVTSRFDLGRAAADLEAIYDDAAARQPDRRTLARSLGRAAVEVAKFKTVRGVQRVRPGFHR
jgi:glycosyltransferase involved in cell wall biosynthesis